MDIQNHYPKNFYFIRLLARVMDLTLIYSLVQALELVSESFDFNTLLLYFVYNIIVIGVSGRTLGKFAFSIYVGGLDEGFPGYLKNIIREILVIVLSPILFLNVLTISNLALHDRLLKTKVIFDER
ncbi:MAG: hypothetical protein OEY59_09170 [Deltaproteobacteria bacterium]|nr:hypothetical protein [Deltaproteobacteria bacterium]